MANHYDIPSWAGKPPVGLHLDVMKGDKLIQKLMVDEKKCYLFGRNPQLNDFCIDHASCSRVHSAMVYHKHLNRAFLVDLGSTHGTYIGSIRLEGQKPTQLPVDSTFHFGASTRMYILRERPQSHQKSMADDKDKTGDEIDGGLLGLPETETELDNLTEFNTAHNRRISMLGIVEEEIRAINHKKKNKNVSYNEEDEVINPEDIDPSVGRFRNLVSTTILPSRKRRIESGSHHALSSGEIDMLKSTQRFASYGNSLYGGIPAPGDMSSQSDMQMFATSLSSKLGLSLPNPAPDVDTAPLPVEVHPAVPQAQVPMDQAAVEPKKKKYAKEAWPGKKPAPTFLM